MHLAMKLHNESELVSLLNKKLGSDWDEHPKYIQPENVPLRITWMPSGSAWLSTLERNMNNSELSYSFDDLLLVLA